MLLSIWHYVVLINYHTDKNGQNSLPYLKHISVIHHIYNQYSKNLHKFEKSDRNATMD